MGQAGGLKRLPLLLLGTGDRTVRTDCRPFPREWSSVSSG